MPKPSKPAKPSLAAIAACAVAALVAAGLLAYALARTKPKSAPAPLPPINKPCSPQPPCDPRLEMPCRAPTEVVPCPMM